MRTSYLKKLRELAGLTQEQAGFISGVNKGTIQNYETFKTGPSENVEAMLETYFKRIGPEKNRELLN